MGLAAKVLATLVNLGPATVSVHLEAVVALLVRPVLKL